MTEPGSTSEAPRTRSRTTRAEKQAPEATPVSAPDASPSGLHPPGHRPPGKVSLTTYIVALLILAFVVFLVVTTAG